MKRWRFSVLIIIQVAFFALILILPQADLPDFTVHGGTSLEAAYSRIHHSPLRVAIATVPAIPLSHHITQSRDEILDIVSDPPNLHSRLSRLRVLIC
jgi:hypothetical protein